jgi:hypothetical protein
MGFISELKDFIEQFKFFDIIDQYQQGLFLSRGRLQERTVKWDGSELEKIVGEEKEVIKKNGGKKRFILPFANPHIPEGYGRSFLTGMPKHPKRYEKHSILKPGLYFFVPVLQRVYSDSIQERIMNLQNISILPMNNGSEAMTISFNIR